MQVSRRRTGWEGVCPSRPDVVRLGRPRPAGGSKLGVGKNPPASLLRRRLVSDVTTCAENRVQRTTCTDCHSGWPRIVVVEEDGIMAKATESKQGSETSKPAADRTVAPPVLVRVTLADRLRIASLLPR